MNLKVRGVLREMTHILAEIFIGLSRIEDPRMYTTSNKRN